MTDGLVFINFVIRPHTLYNDNALVIDNKYGISGRGRCCAFLHVQLTWLHPTLKLQVYASILV